MPSPLLYPRVPAPLDLGPPTSGSFFLSPPVALCPISYISSACDSHLQSSGFDPGWSSMRCLRLPPHARGAPSNHPHASLSSPFTRAGLPRGRRSRLGPGLTHCPPGRSTTSRPSYGIHGWPPRAARRLWARIQGPYSYSLSPARSSRGLGGPACACPHSQRMRPSSSLGFLAGGTIHMCTTTRGPRVSPPLLRCSARELMTPPATLRHARAGSLVIFMWEGPSIMIIRGGLRQLGLLDP